MTYSVTYKHAVVTVVVDGELIWKFDGPLVGDLAICRDMDGYTVTVPEPMQDPDGSEQSAGKFHFDKKEGDAATE